MNVWSLNFIFIIIILVFDFKMNGKGKLMLFYLRLMGFFFLSNVFINCFFVISKRNYDGICFSWMS